MQLRLLLRFISKNPEIYFLKVITLSVAFASLVLISVFSMNEFTFDRFHKNADKIFRVIQKSETEGYIRNKYSTQIPESVYHQLTEKKVTTFTRIKALNELRVTAGNATFHKQQIHSTDGAITDIFDFDLQDGTLEDFTEDEGAILISNHVAEQYFGVQDVAGRELALFTFGDTLHVTVAAVYKSFPTNSHQDFNLFIHFNELSLKTLGFDLTVSEVYGFHPEKVLFTPTEIDGRTYSAQRISDIYFGPRMAGEDVMHGDIYSVIILVSITILILFLALTSFINLTSLSLPHRAKELAVKKLAGHSK
ncbi:MAG: ABC transporter permease, partial [Bacteroidota bacterium]